MEKLFIVIVQLCLKLFNLLHRGVCLLDLLPQGFSLLLETLMPWQVLSLLSHESFHFRSLCWPPCSKASAHNASFTLVMPPRELMYAITLVLSLFLTGKQIQEHLSFVFRVSERCVSQCFSGGTVTFLFAHRHYIIFFSFFLLILKGKKKEDSSLRSAGSYFKKCEKILIIFVTGRSRGHYRSHCVYRRGLSQPKG